MDPSATQPATVSAPQQSGVSRFLLKLAGLTSGLSRPLSGRRWFPLWAIVYHRGRRTGRPRATPVAIRATADGFVISLPFPGAQWYRNVLAAGGCEVRWKGLDYRVVDPQLVDAWAVLPAFNAIQRGLSRLARTKRFVTLRRA